MKKEESPPTHDPEGDRRRLDALDAQLKSVRASAPIPVEERATGSGMSHRQTGVAYRVLVDMIAGLLVGGFLGYWLDRWLGSHPYSLTVGLLVGFAAGVNNAWRAIRVYTAQAEGDETNRLP